MLYILVQARGQHGNPADYFARPMAEYVAGFGDPSKEFWLGLDKLAALTRWAEWHTPPGLTLSYCHAVTLSHYHTTISLTVTL